MPLALRFVKRLLAKIGYGLAGGFIAIVGAYGYYLQDRPDLSPWHTVDLNEEFRAGAVPDFAAYLQLEDRLFDELHRKIYRPDQDPGDGALNRFVVDSAANPDGFERNWNRTFEITNEDPRAGVLLLHGLSDSPYSMRALATALHKRGASVLGLRVPGHGTAPVGLTDITWQDFAGAVRLAARHVAGQVPDGRPFYIVGYSNGAALAVQYSLAVVAGEDLPRPHGLVLLSPAIGITRAAALAVWQARVATATGLDKLAWTDIQPEYDPFKYNSFPVNAGEQMYQLTLDIASRIERLKADSGVPGFPRVLAFQSLIDATVIPAALVDGLMRRLAPEGHELVLFDTNRDSAVTPFMRSGKEQLRDELMADAGLPFTLTLLTNADKKSRDIVAKRRAPFGAQETTSPLGLAWPEGIYSLAHVALPFRPDDALYGYAAPRDAGLHLGRLEPRGERGLLVVGADQMLRLRSNPFLPYVEQRMLDFFDLEEAK
jgi:alpha-beta hydrolase superfamily lysophospholipase